MCLEDKIERIKSLHLSNFIFWVLGKFLIGLGIGILLAAYFPAYGWIIAGWMLIVFAIILQIPAITATFGKKPKVPVKGKK
jgi:uncharacterized membrane protein